jgi:hypothetical protein
MLFTNGPLELTAEYRVTPEGVAIRVAPPNPGALQWADIWVEEEDLARWLQGIRDARERQKHERQMLARLVNQTPREAGESPHP